MPVSSIILAYLVDSERMNARNSAGVLPTGTAACVSSTSRTFGSCRAAAVAFAKVSRMGCAVPLRAKNPNQFVKSKSWKPFVSAMARALGHAGDRCLLALLHAARDPCKLQNALL